MRHHRPRSTTTALLAAFVLVAGTLATVASASASASPSESGPPPGQDAPPAPPLAPGATEAAAPPREAGDFLDGQIEYSTVLNCFSIIQGSPYYEYGTGVYTGAYADGEANPPVPLVNQPVYMHIVVYGVGNPCPGTYFIPAIGLPSGTALDHHYEIICYYDNARMTDCPQWSNVVASSYGGSVMYLTNDTQHARAWPLAQGHHFDLRFPIKSSRQQSNTTLHAYVKTIDGNSSPTLHATAPFFVFAAPSAGTCRGRPVTINLAWGQQPTSGNDVIKGSSGADTINGGRGDDTICAAGGADTINGGGGTDICDGGGGADTAVKCETRYSVP